MEPDDDVDPQDPKPVGLRERMALVFYRLQTVSTLGYMGAASFIGIETAALVIGFTTVLPIMIPFVVLILGGAYFMRERLRKAWASILGRSPDEE
ncbi:hypothetical protein [Glycomyces arizonensis]|uniref:hypothetical protein n=1 Tax=Glycomyces arizonensis TaxID=256035 RepID=UPI0003FDCE82|nr:hypothetical protein [Glycomyces arizonensis]